MIVEYLTESGEWVRDGDHDWHRSTFTGTVTCERCHLLPLDPDDYDGACDGVDIEEVLV